MIDIFGIKIITNYETINYESIGLYAVSGANSEIRYIETELTGLSESWKSGFLFANSFPTFSKSGSFVRGGNTIQLRGSTIRIKNTNRLQAILESDDYKINLIGASVEIVEFRGTDESTITETRNIFTGTIDSVKWSSTEMEIDVVPSRRKLRRSNIVTEGIPVSFGQSDPANGRFFKMVCDTNKKDQLLNKDIVNPESTYYPVKFGLFPITEYSFGENIYTFRIGSSNMSVDASNLVGKYIKCVEGDSTNKDVYRKILSAQEVGITPPTDERLIQITLESYLPVDMVGNWDGIETNQAWIEIYDLEKGYSADSGACGGFFDSETGVPIPDNKAEVYTEGEDGQIIRIPPQSLEVTTENNNSIKSNPLHFSKNPDNVNTYHTIPVESFGLYTEPDLSAFSTTEIDMSVYEKRIDGVYGDPNFELVTYVELVTAYNNENNVYDRKHDTFAYWKVKYQHTNSDTGYTIGNAQKAFKIKLPAIPDNMTFTKAYLGLKLWSKCIDNYKPDNAYIMKRGYINRASNVLDDKKLDEAGDGAFIDNIPDFYYSPEPDTKNKNFFRTEDPESSGLYKTISNHTFFELCETVSEYRAIEELLLFINRYRVFDPSVWTDDETKIYQACVIFETTAEIKDVVYV